MNKLYLYKKQKKFIFLLFIIYITQSNSYEYNYITLDIQKYINNSLNNDEPSNLINYDLYSLYYTDLIFGSQEKKYKMQINLDDYEFKLINYNCEIETDKTDNFFNPFLSESSIIETSGINFTYYGLNKIYRIKDHIKLYKNNSYNYFSPNIIFYYNPRNYSIANNQRDYSPFTCFKLGLRLPSDNLYMYEDYDINIIGQLYRNKIINSYEWFIEYNNENNAKLIIGIPPYEYDKNKYSFNNSRKINGIFFTGTSFYWNIEFSQIYFIINNKRELIDYRKASLEPSFNFIKAPFDYFKIINETLFYNLINSNKCFIKEVRKNTNIYSLYYCVNNEEIKKEIKNRFININLIHMLLEKEFILTYNDLFIEKGNKIYFLIIYDNTIRFNWILGKPFLKKYFFSFNYDKKILTFYEMEKENNINKKEENNKIVILIIIIILLVAIVSVLGFFFAKFIYNYKKRNATELLDVSDDIKKEEEKRIIGPILEN